MFLKNKKQLVKNLELRNKIIYTFNINTGAFLPGIKAVEIIISTSLHCFANKACSASINALDISLLYPAAVPPSS